MLSLLVFIVALGFSQVQSQACPASPIKFLFDSKQFAGLWYEIQTFPGPNNKDLSCVTSFFGEAGTNNFTILNEAVVRGTERTAVKGTAFAVDKNRPNQLVVNWRIPTSFPGVTYPASGTLDIWDTDYTTYALLYSCSKDQSGEVAWIFSRTRTLDDNLVEKLKGIFKNRGVDPSKFRSTNQLKCPN